MFELFFKVLRPLVGCIISGLTGYLVFNLIFKEAFDELGASYGFDIEIEYFFISIFALFGLLFNEIRCLFALVLPSILGKSGKVLIYSIIIMTSLRISKSTF